MNGKESSKLGRRLALSPGLSQEKHTTIFQSRRMGPGRDCRTGAKLPESKFWSNVDPVIATGAGCRAWVSANRRWSSWSIAGGSGFRVRPRFTGSPNVRVRIILPHPAPIDNIPYMGVSGDILSKCQRNSQLLCPAINRSHIRWSRAVWPISPKSLNS